MQCTSISISTAPDFLTKSGVYSPASNVAIVATTAATLATLQSSLQAVLRERRQAQLALEQLQSGSESSTRAMYEATISRTIEQARNLERSIDELAGTDELRLLAARVSTHPLSRYIVRRAFATASGHHSEVTNLLERNAVLANYFTGKTIPASYFVEVL